MTATTKEIKIGNRREDGTVYAGSLAGKALYTTPEDAPLTYTFNEAAKYTEKMNTQKLLGYDDWRVPTSRELNVLFKNRAAIGGFDESGSNPAGWYWSSSQDGDVAWVQHFSDGLQISVFHGKYSDSSLRCVRG